MDRKRNKKLIFSISMNVLLLAFSILLVIKIGGISIIANEIRNVFGQPSEATSYSPYYNDKVNAFDNYPDNNSVVFIGDSLTDYGDWNYLIDNHKIQSFGISGDTTDGVVNRIDSVIKKKPKKVFVMVGVNDISGGKSIDSIIGNYKKIISRLSTESPDTMIYIQSVLPLNTKVFKDNYSFQPANKQSIIQINNELKGMEDGKNIEFIDLYSSFVGENDEMNRKFTVDGLHLNEAGYGEWVESIKQYID